MLTMGLIKKSKQLLTPEELSNLALSMFKAVEPQHHLIPIAL